MSKLLDKIDIYREQDGTQVKLNGEDYAYYPHDNPIQQTYFQRGLQAWVSRGWVINQH